MATHSSILASKILRTEEPGRLQSIGLQRVGHYWSGIAYTHECTPVSFILLQMADFLLFFSFLRLNSILIIYHVFSFSSVDEHWSHFHTLAIAYNAALNMGVQISLPDNGSVFFRYLYTVFPSTVYKGSLYSVTSPTFVISCLFGNRRQNRCETISHCGFDWHFPDN